MLLIGLGGWGIVRLPLAKSSLHIPKRHSRGQRQPHGFRLQIHREALRDNAADFVRQGMYIGGGGVVFVHQHQSLFVVHGRAADGFAFQAALVD